MIKLKNPLRSILCKRETCERKYERRNKRKKTEAIDKKGEKREKEEEETFKNAKAVRLIG